MSAFDLVFGACLILVGVLFAVFGERLTMAIDFASKRFQYFRATVSVTLGVVLVLAASSVSHSSDLIRVIGIVAFVGGIGLFLLPHSAWVRSIRWWTEKHLTFYRVATLVVMGLLGGYLIISGQG